MSRPTAPELLEAASRELRRIRDDNLRIDKPDFHTMTGAIEELERRLSLAQAEIKDWKIAFDGLIAAAEVKTATINGLQARLAELEKVLGGIASAKRFDRTIFAGDDAFADWARSLASHALKSRA